MIGTNVRVAMHLCIHFCNVLYDSNSLAKKTSKIKGHLTTRPGFAQNLGTGEGKLKENHHDGCMLGYLMHREIGQSNPEESIKNVNGMDACAMDFLSVDSR